MLSRGWVLIGCMTLWSGAAWAQDAAPADGGVDLKALQEQVRVLQDQVKALQEAPAPAAPAAPAAVAAATTSAPALDVNVELHNYFVWRNDTDFDRTAPLYNENGQTSGAFATVLRPTLAWHVMPNIDVIYEAEVGLNYWSKNNPDQENALAADIFVLKHRQLFANGTFLNGKLGFKVGYQYFTDTTGLFLGHWIGAAQLWHKTARGHQLTGFVGMVPDTTFEGTSIVDNNFSRDIFVFGARSDHNFLGGALELDVGLHALYDSHVVGQTRWVVAPNVHLGGASGPLGVAKIAGSVDAVVQIGESENTAQDGGDQDILAWAAQGHLDVDLPMVSLGLNVLALSPDDEYLGNKHDGTFLYSSKSRSATMYLTEDETRNWYDQLDRRMAKYQGGFWQHRAGLMVTDLRVSLTALDWFRPSLILAGSNVLKSENALGNWLVGWEGELDLAFKAGKHVIAHAQVGGFIPGKAGAALVNQIDRGATDRVWWTQLAFSVVY